MVVSQPGTYTVTATGPNGCTASATASVNQDITPPLISISPSSGTLTCSQSSLTLTANTQSAPAGGSRLGRVASVASNLVWSTGEVSPSISVSASGTYSVTLTGANGCTNSASVVVSQDQTVPTVSISPSSATLTCNSPTASLSAIGTGAVKWSTGQTSPVISVNTSGTYSVTLTSANGCTSSASIVVGQDQTVPTVSISPSSATLTCNSPTASLSAIGTGSVKWSTGQTSPIISVNASGTYSVTLTGSNGCTSSASVVVGQDQTVPTVSISPSSATLTCNSPTASLSAIGTGAVKWSTNQTTPSISVSASGTYSVTLTGANGCFSLASVVIGQDNSVPMVSISPSSATLTCNSPTASLSAIGTGAVQWSTGQTYP